MVVEAAEAAGKTTFNLPQSERALHWLPDRHLCDRYHSLHKGSQTYSSYSGGDDESIKSVLGVLLLFLLASASTVVSQEKKTSQPTFKYDSSSQQTVHGPVIDSRDFQCPVSGAIWLHITLKTEAGPIEVHLGPAAFMKQYDIKFRKDDNVTVIGSKIVFEGKPAIVARSVVIGNDTYNFRDSSGKPLW